jgi:hypothetical protein
MEYLKELLERLGNALRITTGSKSPKARSGSTRRLDALTLEAVPVSSAHGARKRGVPTTAGE